jgi:hypothetical protein
MRGELPLGGQRAQPCHLLRGKRWSAIRRHRHHSVIRLFRVRAERRPDRIYKVVLCLF